MKRNDVNVYADGFGRWYAEVRFATTLSESDPRPEYNLSHQWESIRRVARNAIVRELTDREKKRGKPATKPPAESAGPSPT